MDQKPPIDPSKTEKALMNGSHSPSFLFHNNGFGSVYDLSDIEMITIQTMTYTSLKDLLPASPPAITSPTAYNSSWHEIPIKNPLLKHAAWAYLQPMSTATETEERGFWGKLKEKCCGECGCVGWLKDVILKVFREVFWERGGEIEEEEEEEDDDDDDHEKVD
ncbi:hypothetical protein HS088_TW02G00045 [Tripterygium wilfordii]|uniref:Uncharacterized protein n=1 Tax=Tripterygium wilfordii TaxID=458696 RepID=A0A7J7DXE4_TRIWF|nr:uncharacterized protein LOC120007127 [Tripterygium wilfordii]KAF5751035.1 hypothetical protein HS088_TW02G00045 [Tripterygium wilfordii]